MTSYTLKDMEIDVYGGPMYSVITDNKRIKADDQVSLADVEIDISGLIEKHGQRKGKLRGERICEEIKAQLKDQGYRCTYNFSREPDDECFYLSAKYPVKMDRQTLYEQMKEAVETGIKKYMESKSSEVDDKKGQRANACFDAFSQILRDEMGETESAELQKKYPHLLGELLKAAQRTYAPSKSKAG